MNVKRIRYTHTVDKMVFAGGRAFVLKQEGIYLLPAVIAQSLIESGVALEMPLMKQAEFCPGDDSRSPRAEGKAAASPPISRHTCLLRITRQPDLRLSPARRMRRGGTRYSNNGHLSPSQKRRGNSRSGLSRTRYSKISG